MEGKGNGIVSFVLRHGDTEGGRGVVAGWREGVVAVVVGLETTNEAGRLACAWKFSPPVAKQFSWKRSYGHCFRQINTARARASTRRLPLRQCPSNDKETPVAIVCERISKDAR